MVNAEIVFDSKAVRFFLFLSKVSSCSDSFYVALSVFLFLRSAPDVFFVARKRHRVHMVGFYIYIYITSADIHVSAFTPCHCSHDGSVFIHMRVLSPQHVGQHGHVNARVSWGRIECSNHRQGNELCNIANGHPINSKQRVLNNTSGFLGTPCI